LTVDTKNVSSIFPHKAAEETNTESHQACRKEVQSESGQGQGQGHVYSANSPLRGTGTGTGTTESSYRCAEQTTQKPSVEQYAAENLAENADNDTKYLSGESPISNVPDSRIQITSGRSITGNLVLTNYRLKFVVSKKLLNSINSPSLFSFLNIPLGCIDRIEKEKKTKEQKLYEQKLFNLHNSSNSSANISSNITISLTCKDMRLLRITLPYCSAVHSRGNNTNNPYNNNNNKNNLFCQESNTETDIENFIQTIAEVAFPNDRRGLFAFSHKLAGTLTLSSNASSSSGSGSGRDSNCCGDSDIISNNSNSNSNSSRTGSATYPQGAQQFQGLGQVQGLHSPVEPYSIMNEYKRLGVLDIISVTEKTEKASLFRVSSANTNYSLCSTYPQALVVPSKMSDEEIQQSANFRSGHRLPVLCWGDKETGAVHTLSSRSASLDDYLPPTKV
jgi:Myotubularin-like phosphatase domain